MSSLILDRLGRFDRPPSFLAPAGPRDRNAGLTAIFLLVGVTGALAAALVSGLAVTLAIALGGSMGGGVAGVLDAVGTLTNSGRPARSLISYGYELAVAGVSSYAAAAVLIALAAWIYRRPPRSFLTAGARFRWPAVAAGFAVAAPLVTLAFLAERAGHPAPLAAPILTPGAGAAERLGYAVAAAACLYLAAFAEEAVFRGWLLQQTAAWTRSAPAILAINGLLFSLAHFDPNAGGFAVRAIMGAGWAWIALRTAGVEFTTGAHLANNLFVALFVAPVKFVAPKPEPFDYRAAFVELAIVLLMIAAVEVYLRRRRSATIAPASGEAAARP